MWRRKKTGVIAVVAGAVLLVAGLADHAFAAPKAALCQSGLGQFARHGQAARRPGDRITMRTASTVSRSA